MRRVSLTSDGWRKSSSSGGGYGNYCVEIAGSPTHAAVRDSKAPNRGILTFHAAAFTTFVASLKEATIRNEPH